MSTIHSTLWAKYSKQYLRQHPLCIYCKRRGKVTPARCVDHIKRAKSNPELFWDPLNHQPLCFTCHASEKQKEELGFVDRLKGGTILCVASGPSLTREDAEFARDKVHATIVTNTTFRLVPWAHIVYAADFIWWEQHLPEIKRMSIPGELWTCSVQAARQYRLNFIRGEVGREGLSRDASRIHTGTNSGYQAIGLAFHLGARRIILLGYDFQRTNGRSHWHGDHTGKCHNHMDFKLALSRIPRLAIDLQSEGVEVVNCSRETAIKSFRRSTIQEVFA